MSDSYTHPQETAPSPTKKARGFALAALIVGIAAFLLGLIPFFGVLVGLAAIILGAVALSKHQPKGMALTGLILGGIAAVTSIVMTFGVMSSTDEASFDTPVAVVEESADPAVAEAAAAAEAEAAAAAANAVPTEFRSALSQAKSYSDNMHMSKAGLYDQLTSEYGGQFTAEAGQYAIDNVDADWNVNAAESGKSYQKTMSMSPAAIHDQLTSEYGGQFTVEEADYAIAHLND